MECVGVWWGVYECRRWRMCVGYVWGRRIGGVWGVCGEREMICELFVRVVLCGM